ncbi:MAG: hypothetical protein ACD_67C00030G0002 [uncultured bacterium]|nr:MAG: hypothetical protein ACD_67C00030G0002 [uncultured bacterium]
MLKKIHNNKRTKKGFTLIEVMLVLALIVIISGISAPVYQSFQLKNNLDVGVNATVQTLRRAQLLSQSGEGDSNWGVHIESGGATLFKGADYATRETSFDEIFEISEDIVVAGMQNIVYSKLSGEPQTSGNIVLTTSTNETETININSKGMIEY